jgi:DNA polymerase
LKSSTRRYLVFDFETFSKADLKKVGATEYARHPSTEVLCVAWCFGKKHDFPPVQVDSSLDFSPFVNDSDVFFVAHNIGFERAILRYVLGHDVPIDRWICTAALARSHGLPGSLDGAAKALGLVSEKDIEGHRVMLQLSKPRRPSKNDPSTRHKDPEKLQRLFEYCKKDVEAETELFCTLKPLNPIERKFWLLDQRMNERGFLVDWRLIQNALRLVDHENKRINRRIKALTQGVIESTAQTLKLRSYLFKWVRLPDLGRKTVEDALKSPKLDQHARKVLRLRLEGSRSSTAKYKAFECRSRSDGRARDNTIFYGAHTGRQSGTGLQPQNLFKSVFSGKDLEIGIDLIQKGDRHTIEALFPKPMSLYASALRGCIVPKEGHVLDVGDFATIEVRVLFWLAQHADGLKRLRDGKDIYIQMASHIFDEDLETLTQQIEAKDESAVKKRQLGKQTVLGAGYGIGVNGTKFQKTAAQYGLEISLELAQSAIRTYRKIHHPIPTFWSLVERNAIRAVSNPGQIFTPAGLSIYFFFDKTWLLIGLPSGRALKYFRATVKREKTLFGEAPKLSYLGVNSQTRKFEEISTWGGKLTENIVQAVSADLLFEAIYRLEYGGGSRPVLAVHDEIIAERPKGKGSVIAFSAIMAQVPEWAKGLPIKVEAWSGERYRK